MEEEKLQPLPASANFVLFPLCINACQEARLICRFIVTFTLRSMMSVGVMVEGSTIGVGLWGDELPATS